MAPLSIESGKELELIQVQKPSSDQCKQIYSQPVVSDFQLNPERATKKRQQASEEIQKSSSESDSISMETEEEREMVKADIVDLLRKRDEPY